MIKIKFIRYDNSGTHGSLCEVPSHILGMYPNYDMHSITKRQRVWAGKGSRAMFGIGNHVLQPLLTDNDFMRSYAPAWAISGLKKYTSNLYVSLYNSEDSVVPEAPLAQVAESQPVPVLPEKKVRKPRKTVEPQVEEKKDKKISFKQMRTKINSKMKVIRALQHFDDPVKVRRFRSDAQSQAEKEHYDKVLTQIFKAYKTFFEEVLESRNIGFYVSHESYEIPYKDNDDGFIVEYTLVDNKENVEIPSLKKQDWRKICLSWLTNKKIINKESRYNREYETFMSTKRIGLTLSDSNDIKKGEVKSFTSMREDTFSKIIDTAFADNNTFYLKLIEEFRAMPGRKIANKEAEDFFKEYLKENIISAVESEDNIDNPELNFEDTFRIKITREGGYNHENIEILEISRHMDNFENMSFRIEFFGKRSKVVNNILEGITLIEKVLQNNFKNIMDVYTQAMKV